MRFSFSPSRRRYTRKFHPPIHGTSNQLAIRKEPLLLLFLSLFLSPGRESRDGLRVLMRLRASLLPLVYNIQQIHPDTLEQWLRFPDGLAHERDALAITQLCSDPTVEHPLP